jgi:hypothetical protein
LKRTFSPSRQALMPIFGLMDGVLGMAKPLQDSCTRSEICTTKSHHRFDAVQVKSFV